MFSPARFLLAVAPLALATVTASAQPFSISSGFETSSGWLHFVTSGATSQFMPGEGNPGNCLSVTLNLQDSFRENAAVYWATTFTLGGPSTLHSRPNTAT